MRGVSTIPARTVREHCSREGRGRGAAPRRVGVDLTPQAVEQVAARVVELLQDRDTQRAPEYISAGELAKDLRVERPWIYKHRHLLGGLRIGDGPKARWRFDREQAIEAMRRQFDARQAAQMDEAVGGAVALGRAGPGCQ
jgi:hypothetical protein